MKCQVCEEIIFSTDKFVICAFKCRKLYHIGCCNLKLSAYKTILKHDNILWMCDLCLDLTKGEPAYVDVSVDTHDLVDTPSANGYSLIPKVNLTDFSKKVKQTKNSAEVKKPVSVVPKLTRDKKNIDTNSAPLKSSSMKTKMLKNKVLVLSDSHGRGCSSIIDSYLSDAFAVECVFKPNAGVKEIVRDVDKLTKTFGPNDHLVLMGGTNDIGSRKSLYQASVKEAIQKVCMLGPKMKVIIVDLPIRSDDANLLNDINIANQQIKKCVENCGFQNIHLIQLENVIKVEHLNKGGLHLNKVGKNIVCKLISDYVRKSKTAPSRTCLRKETLLDRWLTKPFCRQIVNDEKDKSFQISLSAKKERTFLDKWLGVGLTAV